MLSKKDQYWLKHLFPIAKAVTPVGSSRVAAAIVQTNKGALAVGINSYKTHPLQKQFGRNKHSIYLHAEIAALVMALSTYARGLLSDSTLYVVRAKFNPETERFVYGLAKPCPGCMRAIKYYGIKRIVYSK